MPFVEIPPKNEGWVRIGEDRMVISIDLREEHFKNTKVKVFQDDECNLIGLKPSTAGYKITSKGRVWCSKLNAPTGYYPAEWSNTHGMLIVNINDPLSF